MHEDIKRGLIAAIVVVGVLMIGGASLYAASIVAGVAAFAGAIIGWGLDRLFPPPRQSEFPSALFDKPLQRGR